MIRHGDAHPHDITRRLPSPPCTRVIEPEGRNELGTALMNASAAPLVSLWRVYHTVQGSTASFGTRQPEHSHRATVWPHRSTGCLMNAVALSSPRPRACRHRKPCTHNDKRVRHRLRGLRKLASAYGLNRLVERSYPLTMREVHVILLLYPLPSK